MSSRVETSPFAEWWWTVDRWLLLAVVVLMLCGIVFGLAGSPPVAERIGLSTFHFVHRQGLFLIPAALTLLVVSTLSLRQVRRLALALYVVSLAGVFATLLVGVEIKGAHRWLNFGPVSLQPSEFLKPAFVILCAWAFAEGAQRKDTPGILIAMLLLPLSIVPLIQQPDVGQTALIMIVWAALFFLAGLHWFWVAGLGAAGAAALGMAYLVFDHVNARINAFLGAEEEASFQVQKAMEAFQSGGWLGKGPGEGTVKRTLPDSHTDFIPAVIAEEFGLVVLMALVGVFAFIVLRGLWSAQRNEDAFARMATAGLVILFGVQSSINLLVNLHMIPPKGMTLPFVSYGGSSLIAMAIGMGFLVAVTRRRPRAEILDPVGAEGRA
jgi:cell division protein FtsW